MTERVWSVAEAKAHLSEILRLAREKGPQKIGARHPYVVLTEEEWLRQQKPKPHMGEWLIRRLARTGPLELPDRAEPDRASPLDGLGEG